MDLQKQYERIKGMQQTPDVVAIRKKIEVFLHKSRHLEMLADQLAKQVFELERMGDELDREEAAISELISKLTK